VRQVKMMFEKINAREFLVHGGEFEWSGII